jgi:hypothetical protein
MNFRQWLENNQTAADIQKALGGMAGGLKIGALVKAAVLFVQGRDAEMNSFMVGFDQKRKQQFLDFLKTHLPQKHPGLSSSQVYGDPGFDKFRKTALEPFIEKLFGEQDAEKQAPKQFSIIGYLKSQGVEVEQSPDGIIYTKGPPPWGNHAFHIRSGTVGVRNRATGKMVYLPPVKTPQEAEDAIKRIITGGAI